MAAYTGKSLSGTPSQGTTPAHVAGVADSASSREATQTFSVAAGGADWVGEERLCTSTLKDSDWPCQQKAREGRNTCFGHRHDEA